MTIRPAILVFVPLVALLAVLWWLLLVEITSLAYLRILLFGVPFLIVWRLCRA